jgi:Zn-dependent peptidase ImmA (M78 family)
MSELTAIQQVIKTREELMQEYKKDFDVNSEAAEFHAWKAQQAQQKLQALWCKNEKDKQRIKQLQTINN